MQEHNGFDLSPAASGEVTYEELHSRRVREITRLQELLARREKEHLDIPTSMNHLSTSALTNQTRYRNAPKPNSYEGQEIEQLLDG